MPGNHTACSQSELQQLFELTQCSVVLLIAVRRFVAVHAYLRLTQSNKLTLREVFDEHAVRAHLNSYIAVSINGSCCLFKCLNRSKASL
jgi:hypothetical protein